jgi:hypothetical protein
VLKLKYYGQNDGSVGPDVLLTGDPGTDQVTLINAGYLGGVLVALKNSATAGRGLVAVPCDAATETPVGALLNGPGEFAGAIGPSGSGLVPFVRGLFQGFVDSQAFVATPTTPYTDGCLLYCGTGVNAGKYTSDAPANGSVGAEVVAICNQVPSGSYPLLGIISKL